MYFVNEQQIAVRLAVIPDLIAICEQLSQHWNASLLEQKAQERALHLAIEVVTDVGSYLIDGFIMRDASSYEDIMIVIGGEQVFEPHLLEPLLELVRLRRPLVQDYYDWSSQQLHPMTLTLPELLRSFKQNVEQYLAREL